MIDLGYVALNPGVQATVYHCRVDWVPIGAARNSRFPATRHGPRRFSSGKGIGMITKERQLFEIDSSSWELRQRLVKSICLETHLGLGRENLEAVDHPHSPGQARGSVQQSSSLRTPGRG